MRDQIMTWTYQQSTGYLWQDQTYIGEGYAGRDAGLDNPSFESVPDTGPIPHGTYSIGPSFNHPQCGPKSMHLTPDSTTDTFGRSGFLIHGDNSSLNHTASHGCIILERHIRDLISVSPDRVLSVVP